MVALWRESEVIGDMLEYLITNVNYTNYTIFTGIYPNDIETHEAIKFLQDKYPDKIQIVMLRQNGPTSKDDCLNSIMYAIHDYEKNIGEEFQIFVMHDAEDQVSQNGLLVFNHLMPQHDFVQLPVFPSPSPWHQLIAGHYMDEFAQTHPKRAAFARVANRIDSQRWGRHCNESKSARSL